MKPLFIGLFFAVLAVTAHADERSDWGKAIRDHLASTPMSSRAGTFSDQGITHKTEFYLAIRTDGTLMQVGFSNDPRGNAESIKGPVGGAQHAVALWAREASPFPAAPEGMQEGVYTFVLPMKYRQLRDFSKGSD